MLLLFMLLLRILDAATIYATGDELLAMLLTMRFCAAVAVAAVVDITLTADVTVTNTVSVAVAITASLDNFSVL